VSKSETKTEYVSVSRSGYASSNQPISRRAWIGKAGTASACRARLKRLALRCTAPVERDSPTPIGEWYARQMGTRVPWCVVSARLSCAC
jgi:hypothetical protein